MVRQEALTSPASGQERSPLQALRLFPNPAQDLVFLELGLPYSARVRAVVKDALVPHERNFFGGMS